MSDPEGRPTVSSLLETVGARVVPVGRLDFATSGALLATNDGTFANGLLHPKKAVPKTYVVKCAGRMETSDLDRWREGITLEDGKTLPAEVTFIRHEKGESGSGDKTWFELTIKEGRNQQIRRMGTASGYPVMRLSRTAFAGITTEGLRPGGFRYLTRQELITLKKAYGVPKSIPSDLPKEMEQPQYRPKQQRRASSSERERPAHRKEPVGQTGTEGVQPRYGMGSPGRRPADTREEYGGRSGRGSSGTRPGASTPPPRGGVGGGRFSGTRTTGSGGGVGGSTEGSYRMTKGRKR
jgi:23S rRNA pseudouridine2605 synthase